KDGPSAGITVAVALLSVATGRAVDRRLAMTGEITLRGDVLPIGGLKEKLLAARAAGVRTVLLPKQNRRDLAELPPEAQRDLELVFVERMEEVLARALAPTARPVVRASQPGVPKPRAAKPRAPKARRPRRR